MPKVVLSHLPLSGLFAVAKPSGPTSMSIINDIKQLLGTSRLFVESETLEKYKGQKLPKRGRKSREVIKMGQGGTLDPLADGVLVVGVGKGTKRLSEFLDCVKEYRATCLLGCETDSYDSEGAIVRVAPWLHVTKPDVENVLEKFRGEIEQIPPIFSALKMDGKPLYEYAREGIPLPRPIEKRKVSVRSLELVDWRGNNHPYRWPDKKFSDDEKKALKAALQSVGENSEIAEDSEAVALDVNPTAFVLQMKVSGGTYVRSIVHDVSHALGSAGHVVTLTRLRQGRFTLDPTSDTDMRCVPWEVFQKATEAPGDVDEDGWTEWERQVMDSLEVVEGKAG